MKKLNRIEKTNGKKKNQKKKERKRKRIAENEKRNDEIDRNKVAAGGFPELCCRKLSNNVPQVSSV